MPKRLSPHSQFEKRSTRERSSHICASVARAFCAIPEFCLALNQPKEKNRFARYENDESRERSKKPQSDGEEKIAEFLRIAEITVGPAPMEQRPMAGDRRLGIGESPGTYCGGNTNEESRQSKQQTFQKSRMGLLAHQRPDNVIAIHQVGQKGHRNNEQMKQRLVTKFEIGCPHRHALFSLRPVYRFAADHRTQNFRRQDLRRRGGCNVLIENYKVG